MNNYVLFEMKNEKKIVAFYDMSCGVCSKTKDIMKNKEISTNIDFTPLSDPKFQKLLQLLQNSLYRNIVSKSPCRLKVCSRSAANCATI